MIQTPTRPSRKESDVYWEKFEQLQKLNGSRNPSWLIALRKAAVSRFAETGYPTLKDEDWRFTNVAPIAGLAFQPVLVPGKPVVTRQELNGFPLAGLPGNRLVFIDGHYAKELSSLTARVDGARICSLAAALEQGADLIERHLARHALSTENPFVALNTAFFADGAFVHIPKGQVLREPVQLLHIATSPQGGATLHPRHLIVVESGSSVTIVENYVTLPGSTSFTNTATELVIGDGAKVEYCKLENEGAGAYHMATLDVELEQASDFAAHSFVLGARFARNNIRTTLAGEGIECVLNGLYLTKDDQLADHHMIVDHAKPHCSSHEYFNGILDGHSRGVFHGRILVRPDAQKTDAKQTNKNLLLSDDAVVDTKPQLEIYADDVKCTHGATVGQLNEESIFYLRARGIGHETARRMLMHAFAGEIIARVRHPRIREELDRLVWTRLEVIQQIAVH